MEISSFPDLYKEILLHCGSISDVIAFGRCSKETYKFVNSSVCDPVWKHFYYADFKHDFCATIQEDISITMKYWEKTAQQTRLEDKRATTLLRQKNVHTPIRFFWLISRVYFSSIFAKEKPCMLQRLYGGNPNPFKSQKEL
jgi:hypothetical protein